MSEIVCGFSLLFSFCCFPFTFSCCLSFSLFSSVSFCLLPCSFSSFCFSSVLTNDCWLNDQLQSFYPHPLTWWKQTNISVNICVCVYMKIMNYKQHYTWSTCGVMFIIIGNSNQILDEAVCISHSVNTLGKGMNLFSLHLCINNRIDRAL